MKTHLEWVAAKAALIMAGTIGAVLGLFVSMPLGWKIPDTTANLMGGLIGAVASVAGAMMVVNRQIAADERRRRLDGEAVKRKQANDVEHLQRALANALHNDLRVVDVMLNGQILLSQGYVFNGNKLESESDYVDWCRRMELLPMPAFHRFSHLLHYLGSISTPLIHAYAEIERCQAIYLGQRTQRKSDRDCVEFVKMAKVTLPAIRYNVQRAMAELDPFTCFATAEEAKAAGLG